MLSNTFKKALAVAVILLFIGVAFAPSINANISKASIDSELVEITTEVCGLKGGKHTVSLSKEDAEDVEQLFDDIERRLDKVETREEAVEIFKEAVVELDKYGLLGGLSVEQAQKLVTSRYMNLMGIKSRERINKSISGDGYWNLLCLIAGATTVTSFFGRLCTASYVLSEEILFLKLDIWWLIKDLLPELLRELVWQLLWLNILPILFHFIFVISTVVSSVIPLQLGGVTTFGLRKTDLLPLLGTYWIPSTGWLFTLGLNGIKKPTTPFYGQFIGFTTYPPFEAYEHYRPIGVIGFRGIKIGGILSERSFYLGSALSVKLTYETPNL